MRWILIFLTFFLPIISYAGGFASNDHFVIYAPTQELADTILKNAEEYREKITITWFKKPIPSNAKPCTIYAKIAKKPCGFGPINSPKAKYLSILMEGPEEQLQSSLLKHELTHAVLKMHFTEGTDQEIPS